MDRINTSSNKTVLGICIKNNEFMVLSQNDNCKRLCGDLEGKKCDKNCFKCVQIYSNASEPNYIFDRIISINGDEFQIIVIKDDETITTIQKPIGNYVRELLNQVLSYQLTATEINILKLKIFGYSNLEIAKLNFIALSTVKSHLNHIFTKVPESLASKIKNLKN